MPDQNDERAAEALDVAAIRKLAAAVRARISPHTDEARLALDVENLLDAVAALTREVESLREWRELVRGAPEGAQVEVQARMFASQHMQPVVAAWRGKVGALEAENARLREALRPLAGENIIITPGTPDIVAAYYAEAAFRGQVAGTAELSVGDVRRARAALLAGDDKTIAALLDGNLSGEVRDAALSHLAQDIGAAGILREMEDEDGQA
jgi:hypothetical protein